MTATHPSHGVAVDPGLATAARAITERELARKEKALAEVAALLDSKKKVAHLHRHHDRIDLLVLRGPDQHGCHRGRDDALQPGHCALASCGRCGYC